MGVFADVHLVKPRTLGLWKQLFACVPFEPVAPSRGWGEGGPWFVLFLPAYAAEKVQTTNCLLDSLAARSYGAVNRGEGRWNDPEAVASVGRTDARRNDWNGLHER